MSTTRGKFTSKDWDDVRMGFNTSILVDTPLNSLAQSLDARSWPLPGKDETPAKYIDLPFEELAGMPGLSGHPERVDQLITILRETLAFDDPFDEMVKQSEEKDNPLVGNLGKLEIPENFPIEQAMISAEAKDFCRLEKIATLGEFARFAQNMSPQVVVGGDFRSLLNALAHVNEEALATILPFRPGAKGLHLPEALGHLIDTVPEAERLALFRRYGGRLKPDEEAQAARLSKQGLVEAEAALRQRAAAILDFHQTELDELAASLLEGGSLERYLIVLEDPLKETLAAELLAPVVNAPTSAEEPAKRRGLSGFFAWLFRR
jgi:hypothetical protein